MEKRLQQGVNAIQFNNEGRNKRAGERGRHRKMHIDSRSSVRASFATHSSGAHLLPLRNFVSSVAK